MPVEVVARLSRILLGKSANGVVACGQLVHHQAPIQANSNSVVHINQISSGLRGKPVPLDGPGCVFSCGWRCLPVRLESQKRWTCVRPLRVDLPFCSA